MACEPTTVSRHPSAHDAFISRTIDVRERRKTSSASPKRVSSSACAAASTAVYAIAKKKERRGDARAASIPLRTARVARSSKLDVGGYSHVSPYAVLPRVSNSTTSGVARRSSAASTGRRRSSTPYARNTEDAKPRGGGGVGAPTSRDVASKREREKPPEIKKGAGRRRAMRSLTPRRSYLSPVDTKKPLVVPSSAHFVVNTP